MQLECWCFKFIHVILHSDNDVVKSVMIAKLQCPSSIMAEIIDLFHISTMHMIMIGQKHNIKTGFSK